MDRNGHPDLTRANPATPEPPHQDPAPRTTLVQVEISLTWASANPHLFLDAVADFRSDYATWGVKVITARRGFLTLAASRDPDLQMTLPTPAMWMEARCGSVCSNTSPNWQRPEACHQTVRDGGFFRTVGPARAKRFAFARDKASGTVSGITVADVTAAVDAMFEENKDLDHGYALREFMEKFAQDMNVMAEAKNHGKGH